ncbi:uncharacterized protein BDR25DRAFT_357208 [Lindgomyces ingoldianus]|uniref:Uncharacterized protein n=1 Tax=Lindgomyces ingoldianus TaxID=673940 RepID=A0ACB6QPL4_9PLEO|nr:uncharacterized protein BDR25DRAFT_357208 [Lindgomyces ingoldianus]KAF2468841.1 hypothetical protein BDR25DRAFT_357208 [Lindgomyces ingoldianus]
MTLTFPPRPSPPRPRKRCRAVTDVDGEYSCLHKKKRRLRLFLITSRLSPQFSHPATNIVDRGSSKIAVWAKQRALGRNLLRKAAILNRIRRQAIQAKETNGGLGRVLVEQEREQKQLELARLAFVYGSHDTHTRPVLHRVPSVSLGDHFELSRDPASGHSSPTPSSPTSSDGGEDEASSCSSPNDAYFYASPRAQSLRKSYIPLPPSPLGLSNYDAFDLEDEITNPYSHLDEEDELADDENMHDVDSRSPSANTSASYSSTLSTVGTGPSEAAKTPPPMFYSDFSILDPGEPVVGDYDGVDDGAEAIWPSALGHDIKKGGPSVASSVAQPSLLPASSSPNFSAIFATAPLNDAVSVGTSLVPDTSAIDALAKKEAEIKEERARQKSLMFLKFNS